MTVLIDGHVHTPYCPHGSTDSFKQYVEKAISLGYQQMTFTEHAPFPDGFTDPTPKKDSAMKKEHLESYIKDVWRLKEEYLQDINILCGLEVDYLEGFEDQTASMLHEYGPYLDDGILSVHFLKKDETWFCIDYSPDMFRQMIDSFGSVENVYKQYYETVLKSIQADLGPYKPKRIGHMTLVQKFQKKYPCNKDFSTQQKEILLEIKRRNYELDYNAAGLNKPLCQETYPPRSVIQQALEWNIPLVYGSDAHSVSALHQGRDLMWGITTS
jgi:histidinol-phosphatase (PHP family)